MSFEENVMRFEFKVYNSHLNNKKYKNKTEKTLKNYFKDELYLKYRKKNFEAIIYTGDHYKIFKVDTILKNNTELNKKSKKQIREFLVQVSE